jgi:hypothetical protein
MAGENAAMTKIVRAKISRRNIDSSQLNIRCSHGIIYLIGVIRTTRAEPNLDLNREKEHISTVLRSVPGVREIVWDVTQRT